MQCISKYKHQGIIREIQFLKKTNKHRVGGCSGRSVPLLGICTVWLWCFYVTAYNFSRLHMCYVCAAQQELPGGGKPAGEDWRLWHVQGRLQHWLLQGRCMCPPLYFILLFLISHFLSLTPAAWILLSSSPTCAWHHQLRGQKPLGLDHLAQLNQSMAAIFAPMSTINRSLQCKFPKDICISTVRLTQTFGGEFFSSVKQPVTLPQRPSLINGTNWLIGAVHVSCPLHNPQWQSDSSDSDREFKRWQRQDRMREWTLNFG